MTRQREASRTHRIMASIPSKNTRPEWAMRRALHAIGLRYRLHRRDLPGTPDLVFPAAKVAVFVDGDFWHGGGWQERGFANLEDQFATNRKFWIDKIQKNIEHDRQVERELESLGWTVVRVLESEIRRDSASAILRVTDAVQTGSG